MGIKALVKKAGGKAADKVAKLAVLSPEQIEKVENQREQYLLEMPDPNDSEAEELTMRLLAACGVEVFNAYLPQLKELYVPIEKSIEYDTDFVPAHNIRYFNITKWVTDKKENSLEKLVNVYEVLSNEYCNIALIFHRMCNKTEVFLAVTNTENAHDNVDVDNYTQRLQEAIKGNFPGSEYSKNIGKGKLSFLNNETAYSVATASNVPAEKSEKFISQTIEKLLDGIVPETPEKEYTIILLATPILDVEERKLRLAEFYSGLKPFMSWNTQFTYQESKSEGSSATFGLNVGASAGVQNGTNASITDSSSRQQNVSDAYSESQTETQSTNSSESKSSSSYQILYKLLTNYENATGKDVGKKLQNALKNTMENIKDDPEQNIKDLISMMQQSTSTSQGTSNAVGKTLTKTLGKAVSTSKAVMDGVSKATNFGANFGTNFARTSNVTTTIGKNESISQFFENYNIKHSLELLESQMKRYEQSTALGMWDFAAYILSEDQNVAANVAHSYIALTEGENSYMSKNAINLWRGDMGEESNDAKEICGYLRELRHPLFGLSPALTEIDNTLNVYPSVVTATTPLSGKELAYSLNFPQKSVAGLPVIECAEFGRNITSYDNTYDSDKKIKLGKIYHMNHEENTRVLLSEQSLASHTFITGSTGSGKSNTVYQLISEARKNGVKILVIEPAKGEYKDVLGMDSDVSVFGTNPAFTPLLRINPFSFPSNIHVLEHLDRLVEIFNVCWPMYAAMPAVLKNAIEKSYEDCGWNLTASTNSFGDNLYPTFKDVCRNIKTIIESSEYDAENKGAYKGSLLTRLQSLTNGINGMIFADEEIDGKMLFDSNVIIDISRVGSSETKSLIMGMLILKLQEYRMSNKTGSNSELRHLTVLEEAHNILKGSTVIASNESGNLAGKSVEMISNAIAEMRTYGEGFIIADQAPGLLDMAAIRNTNTKIIMRLPDQSDRELVGKAANLNDDQIAELAKLPCGVAAIYQNEWIQPVLCKIDYYDSDSETYEHKEDISTEKTDDYKDRLFIAELLSNGTKIETEAELKEISLKMKSFKLPASIQVAILKMLSNPAREPNMLNFAPVMNCLFPEIAFSIKNAVSNESDVSLWAMEANTILKAYDITDQVRRDIIQGAITHYLLNEMNNRASLEDWIQRGGLR